VHREENSDDDQAPRRYLSTHIASFLGWKLDAFDFFIVVFVVPNIAHDFGTDVPAIALAITVTLTFRPVGRSSSDCSRTAMAAACSS
jgi:MFS family permease